jgi:UDP-N-acetyl-D-mannosaminuronic acid transferase (WecB/TagA/CpsF family)
MKGAPIPQSGPRKLHLKGVTFDALTEREVVDTVFASLASGVGGHLITPNVDILLRLQEPRALQSTGPHKGSAVRDDEVG